MGIIKSRFKRKNKRKPTELQIIKFPKNKVRDKYYNPINGYIVTYFIELIPINKNNIDTLKYRDKITIHQDRNTLYTSIVAVYFLSYKGGILYHPLFFKKTGGLVFNSNIYNKYFKQNMDIWFNRYSRSTGFRLCYNFYVMC